MPEFESANDLKELASQIIRFREEVSHVDVERVLFLRELEDRPGNGCTKARTYKWGDHPIGFFTDMPFGIVFYDMNIDYMSDNQLKMLMFHELLHIPEREEDKLVDHTHKDFRQLLKIDVDWGEEGRKVPDILGGD